MGNKTVYVLGAGASRTANLPMQGELIALIFSIRIDDINSATTADFLELSVNEREERLKEIYPIFDEYRQELGNFIVENFSSRDKINEYTVALEQASKFKIVNDLRKNEFLFKAYEVAKSINISLEDLFTIFDNVALGREHFRLYSPEKMAKTHNELKLCIIYSLTYALAKVGDNTQYIRFANVLMKRKLSKKYKNELVSVISMNWDDILENILYTKCEEHNQRKRNKILPDLCFYDYSIGNSINHLPSTHVKVKGYNNVKVLKMHGSLGWLECPKCGRIYTDFTRNIAMDEYFELKCPKCGLDQSIIGDVPILRNFIITPTFMKSLSDLNLKNIWHNAYIDLSEAENIIFIGYSFPDADFEMRCLLKKSVGNNTKIKVVLHETDDPNKYLMSLMANGCSEKEANQFVSKMFLPDSRYKSFFGQERVEFSYNGMEGFLDEIGG